MVVCSACLLFAAVADPWRQFAWRSLPLSSFCACQLCRRPNHVPSAIVPKRFCVNIRFASWKTKETKISAIMSHVLQQMKERVIKNYTTPIDRLKHTQMIRNLKKSWSIATNARLEAVLRFIRPTVVQWDWWFWQWTLHQIVGAASVHPTTTQAQANALAVVQLLDCVWLKLTAPRVELRLITNLCNMCPSDFRQIWWI